MVPLPPVLFLSDLCVCVCVCSLWTIAHQAPLSMEIFQARILEWIVISYSRRSSLPRHQAHVSCVSSISRLIFHHCDTWTLELSDPVVLKMSVQWDQLKGA